MSNNITFDLFLFILIITTFVLQQSTYWTTMAFILLGFVVAHGHGGPEVRHTANPTKAGKSFYLWKANIQIPWAGG